MKINMNIKMTARTVVLTSIFYLAFYEVLFQNFLRDFLRGLIWTTFFLIILALMVLIIHLIRYDYRLRRFYRVVTKYGSESDLEFLENNFSDNTDFHIKKINFKNVDCIKEYEHEVLAEIEYENDSITKTQLNILKFSADEIIEIDASKLILIKTQDILIKIKNEEMTGNEKKQQ